MRRDLRCWWTALLLFSMTTGVSWAQAEGLRDFEGGERTLSEFTGQGKWLVVMIWASDCHVCNAEAYQYVDFHDMHEDDNANVLGVSMDGQGRRAEALAFIERHSLSFANLIAEPGDVARLYRELTGEHFVGTPSLLVFNPRGELRAGQAGAVPASAIDEFIRRESARAALSPG
jgi:peroxiredoxin